MKKHTKRSGYTHINESDFKNIKMLQKAGLTAGQASKATKRSRNTVGMIYKCDTFKEYKDEVRAFNSKYPKNDPEQLASTSTLSEAIRQAKLKNGLIITTRAAFTGFDDLYDFVKEASDNEVTVTFAPVGKK